MSDGHRIARPAASAASSRWYAGGLRFACTGCGRCCTGGDGYVWVSGEEIVRLASRFGLEPDEFGRRYVRRIGSRYALLDRADRPGGECIFLDGRSCSVYEDRPAQCRAYPWWPSNLATPDAWRRAAAACEGISESAAIVASEDIEAAREAAERAGVAAAECVDSPRVPPHGAAS